MPLSDRLSYVLQSDYVNVTLPEDWRPGTRLPALFWFYPREYTSQEAYDRLRSELDTLKNEGRERIDAYWLIYAPGLHASTDEIVALASAAAGVGGLYASHVRGEAETVFDAVAECIEVGRRAGVPAHVSHLKVETRPMWGRATDLLALIDAGEFVAFPDALRFILAVKDAGIPVAAASSSKNAGLMLGAFIGATLAAGRDKLTVALPPSLASLGLWIEQLVAESTGKSGTGILPVVADTTAPEVALPPADVTVMRLCGDLDDGEDTARTASSDGADVWVRGSLGAQMLLWEVATAVAGRILGIDPFDQPDVESAKKAARGMLEGTPEREAALFTDGPVEVRVAGDRTWLGEATDLRSAVAALLQLSIVDPACGSGHFLVFALPILAHLRMAGEGISAAEACDAVLRDNLFGLLL